MSEKRFTYGETIDYNFFDVFEGKKYVGMIQRDSTKIVDRLNELSEENEQLRNELQQTKEYLQTKIDECKNHKKMKEIVFGVEQAVGYEKALLQFQKGLKRRLNNE